MKLKKGRKYDAGKPRWDLLPARELEQVVKVLTHGAKKYGADNWQLVVNADADRYVAAHGRHLNAWQQGEIIDSGPKGSGLPHLAHAICCLLFLLWRDNNGTKKTEA